MSRIAGALYILAAIFFILTARFFNERHWRPFAH